MELTGPLNPMHGKARFRRPTDDNHAVVIRGDFVISSGYSRIGAVRGTIDLSGCHLSTRPAPALSGGLVPLEGVRDRLA
jgi:hypothetical protein